MMRPLASDLPHVELETLLELGEGGMARAYLARALGPGGFERLVVIKRLNLRLLGVPDMVERFLAEARIAARIHHANVVGTQQVGRDASGPFIVLDYIEGGSLDDLITDTGLPIPVVLRIALDALAGLQAVHEARDVDGRPLAILHRDVSLQNLLVSAVDGVARLADFGVAKSVLGKIHTEDGVLVGKLVYFPPEYLRREPVGPQLDLYALGVTLWLALTGTEPWEDANEAQIIREILDNGMPRLDRYVTVAPSISEFVMRACERDPARRFQSAREMAEVLQRFDRERGWLASHAEVAKLVSDVLGPELHYRRVTISRLTRTVESTVVAKGRAASLPPLPAPSAEMPSRTRRLNPVPRPAEPPNTRRLAGTVVSPTLDTEATPASAARKPKLASRALMLGVPAALAASAAIGAVVWAISHSGSAEEVPAPALDVVHASKSEPVTPPNLDVSRLREQSNAPPPSLEQRAPVETNASASAQTLPTVGARRAAPVPRASGNEALPLARKTSTDPSSLRKQNPYRDSSE